MSVIRHGLKYSTVSPRETQLVCFCGMTSTFWRRYAYVTCTISKGKSEPVAKACGHEGNSTLISRIFPAAGSSNLARSSLYRRHVDFVSAIASQPVHCARGSSTSRAIRVLLRASVSPFETRNISLSSEISNAPDRR